MSMTCKTCRRDDIEEINSLIAAGKPLRYFVDNYGIPNGSIQRHRDECIDGLFAEVREAKRAGLLKDVDKLKAKIARIEATFPANPNAQVQLLARYRDAIDLEAKLTGAYIKDKENAQTTDALAAKLAEHLKGFGWSEERIAEVVASEYQELGRAD